MKVIFTNIILAIAFMFVSNAYAWNCPNGKSPYYDEWNREACCTSEGKNCEKPIPEDEGLWDTMKRKLPDTDDYFTND